MSLYKRLPAFFIFLCIYFLSYAQVVTPWITTGDKAKLLQQQTTVSFAANTGTANVTVTLNPTTTYQTIDGFGFCLTEGSAEVISGLSTTQQTTLLNELFNKTTGIGVSVLRISIGASDLSSSDYSYDEVSGDIGLAGFSLSGPDLTYLIPMLKKILAINPDIKILATPWSAPRWMKTNKAWIGGSLVSTYYDTYAKYFVKYLNAMKGQGINIWALTVQNEPENGTAEPSMLMTSTEQKTFINSNLGPELANSGFGAVKIIAYDHNCNNTTYPIDVCNNSTYVDGAAFHLYSGDISALTMVKNATGKNVYFTEQYTASTGSFSGDFGWHMQNVIFGSVQNWAKATLEWNLANNPSIGPHTSGGCSSCLGAVTINSTTSYTYNLSYYLIGQISKFVKPGAIRIGTTVLGTGIMIVGFQNPDGSMALMVYNAKTTSQTVKTIVDSQAFTYTMPASTVGTFVWTPTPNAINDVRINPIQLTPNPGGNFVKLKQSITGEIYKNIEFYSLGGSLVLKQNVSGIETEINTSKLAQGVYLVKISTDKNQYYNRFIKQ